jgi:hypothetical protein
MVVPPLTVVRRCSYSVHMASAIDSLGKAARHGMLVRVECPRCCRRKEIPASALMMDLGAGRDPLQIKFRCRECTPRAKVSLHEPLRSVPKKAGTTIGEMILRGESLYVNCHDPQCQSSAKVDLEALAKRLGWDHGAMHEDLVGLFVCSRCRREGRPRAKVGFTCIPDYDGEQRRRRNAEPYRPTFRE